MARLGSWIESHPEGIYVRPADAWIDPSQPKARAWVTHGHGDHARGGHGAVLATSATLAIMETRYGPQSGQAIAYDEPLQVGEVSVRFVPAGHVLGSAQIVMEHKGERVVVCHLPTALLPSQPNWPMSKSFSCWTPAPVRTRPR